MQAKRKIPRFLTTSVLGSLAAAGLALAGCSGPPACRPGTLQVTLTFDDAAVRADGLTATVTLPSGSRSFTKTHFPGLRTQEVPLDLDASADAGASYAAGASYTLDVNARLGTAVIASGSAQGVLASSCTLVNVNLVGNPPPDAAVPPDAAAAPDASTAAAVSGSGAAR